VIFFSALMFIEFLGSIWRRLPGMARRRLVRMGQRRFTVTAGAMIFDDQDRILLLDHVFRPDGGWGIPGGFLTKGEQPEAGLRRELKEEIGIEVEAVEMLFARTLPRPRQIEIYFRARAVGKPEPCSFEIRSAGWFAVNDLPRELSKDQRRLIQRALDASENSNQ
jgi:ADP-ribose pyrophosphatase YjhB (NUDIX family)